jgi:hypothetical protein
MFRIVLVINHRPPRLWAFNNVPILVASALLPLMWWGTVQLLFSWLWQEVYGWTAMNVAVHLYMNIILIAVFDGHASVKFDTSEKLWNLCDGRNAPSARFFPRRQIVFLG